MPSGRSARVLVVDDTIEVAQTIGWMLEEIGYDYQLVHDGRKALAAAREFRPDAILLDIGLPGMSGFDVAKQLRDEFGEATPKLIAVTGYGRRADRKQSAAAGIDEHLVKPLKPNELVRVLNGAGTRGRE